ncbi:MAG: hypothetical protein ATN31_04905 [Candidatus Epulonipiscioides saccharophilum]|nr:MAG: hypothetical protein ATN31_04905 [Epulopiscium sp. AS2M-Bin001]
MFLGDRKYKSYNKGFAFVDAIIVTAIALTIIFSVIQILRTSIKHNAIAELSNRQNRGLLEFVKIIDDVEDLDYIKMLTQEKFTEIIEEKTDTNLNYHLKIDKKILTTGNATREIMEQWIENATIESDYNFTKSNSIIWLIVTDKNNQNEVLHVSYF